ncbi:MAG: stage III sporulation protein AC [Thermaerobacter sp.]|nr:stage III sporulation protein AC [Bacillota bacterium]REJ34498.1 MAG: stage III sporulation protein AC [Bacillota bacterium]
MELKIILQIAGVGLLVAVLHSVLRQAGKEEYGHVVTVAGVIIVFWLVVNALRDLFRAVTTIFQLQ